MVARNYRNVKPRENPHNIDVRQLYDDPSAQIMHITLRPGESLKPHKTPVDVVFYVLEGNPGIYIGNENCMAEKDMFIESPADIVHYMVNNGNSPARVLVIKAPRPVKPTRLL